LSVEAWDALDAEARADRLADAKASLTAAGADFVIDTVADLPGVVDAIAERLRRGERPAL
jgi:phosphonoacetaldehyde hydrolase